MNKTCDNFEQLIDLKAAGWLSADEAADLERHLQSCPACRAQAEAAESAARLLAELPAPAAPVIDVASYPAPASRRPWLLVLIPAAAACLMLGLWMHSSNSSAPPVPGPVSEHMPTPELDNVRILAEAPPTLATYRQALSLSDDDLDRVLDAHDRQIALYKPRLGLLASYQAL